MNFDYIKTLYATVKPHVDAGTDVWVKCDHLGWTGGARVRMRPDTWTGAPFPTSPGDHVSDLAWAKDPWEYASPCSDGTFLKGKLAASGPEMSSGLVGNTVLFKPEGLPTLTGYIWSHDYTKVTTAPPAGWKNSLAKDYGALLQKVDQQKAAGLW